MQKEIILDTETTGLNPKDNHRIVEIGAVLMIDKVLTGEQFHCYLNPERDMPIVAYNVHGLSSEFLMDKPLFKDVADDFLEFIKDAKLVIHNASFDVGFLNHELKLLNSQYLIDMSHAIDTISLARKKFPGSRVNLDALCKRFKIDNSSRITHGALKDALLLAEVYVELTGGRQVTFALEREERDSKINLNSEENKNNIIIYASDQEKLIHRKFMNKIFSK